MPMVSAGSTAHFSVSYDSALTGSSTQPPGSTLAESVLDYCEYDYERLSLLFGGIEVPSHSLPVAVEIVSSTSQGGASNDGIGAIAGGIPPTITIYVLPDDVPAGAQGVEPVMVAELAEIFMDVQNNGWISNWSAGEGLSRLSGQLLYPQWAWLFAVGSEWYNMNTYTGPADWVDQVEDTDRDGLSYGCASLFLNYLAYQLNYTWPTIIAAGSSSDTTLAQKAEALGVTNPYQPFLSLIQQYFPNGDLTVVNDNDELIDDLYPLGPLPAQLPEMYMRHNTADDGTSHSGPLGDSPDIIIKNAQVAQPLATYSTAASIASANESDSDVLDGQANYVYLRVWNRGSVAARNVFATIYWSPVSTLPTPTMWNLIGDAYYPNVPVGSAVEVSVPGVVWPASQIPGPGHYCFVATVGNSYQPPPDLQTLVLGSSTAYYDYILNNNNITWRNFNVVQAPAGGQIRPPHPVLKLPFLLTGGWDIEDTFGFETIADLPKGSELALQVAEPVGRAMQGAAGEVERVEDHDTDPDRPERIRIPVPATARCRLGDIRLPAGNGLPSHLLVSIPPELHDRPYEVAVRQLYGGYEIGRVTWQIVPAAPSLID